MRSARHRSLSLCGQAFAAAALVACALPTSSPHASTAVSTPQLVKRINTHGFKPCGSAVFGKYLYVDNYGSGTIARLDPRTNRVVKTLRVGDGPCGVVSGGGALWVENYHGRKPADREITASEMPPTGIEPVHAV